MIRRRLVCVLTLWGRGLVVGLGFDCVAASAGHGGIKLLMRFLQFLPQAAGGLLRQFEILLCGFYFELRPVGEALRCLDFEVQRFDFARGGSDRLANGCSRLALGMRFHNGG